MRIQAATSATGVVDNASRVPVLAVEGVEMVRLDGSCSTGAALKRCDSVCGVPRCERSP